MASKKIIKKLLIKPLALNKEKNKINKKVSRLTLRLQAGVLVVFIMIIAGGILFFNYYLNKAALAFVSKSTGDVVTASDWNEIGTSNSKVQTLTDNTVYQNNTKHKLIVVAYANATVAQSDITGYIGSANPPNLIVASDTGTSERRSITFIVPVGWWYKVNIGAGSLTAEAWEI